ncbi:MAG: AtpZ/AtpI family protein [Ottowia sp.]|nr:AtpZ/AtpI family protein [Ottowia sp.]
MKTDRDPSLDPIRRDAERLRRTRRRPAYSPLRGLGAFGVVGWSIAIPTVGGALLGLWLDKVAPARFSWPIALILGGLVIGILVAWDWMAREDRLTRDEGPETTEEDEGNA